MYDIIKGGKVSIMKNLFSFLCLLVFCVIAGNAIAYNAPIVRPLPTSFAMVAMQFYKLTAQTPDFESWVKIGQAYKTASPFDQKMILAREKEKLEDIFRKVSPASPIIVETFVDISQYSIVNKGFLIDNFTEDTFFSIDFNGIYYALVPNRVLDHQWMKVTEEEAKRIENAKIGGGAGVRMYLELTPKYADSASPLLLGDHNHWLISADITKMMLFDRENLIWQKKAESGADPRHQQLMDLYR